MVGFNTCVCNSVTISSKFADLVEFNNLQESVKVVKKFDRDGQVPRDSHNHLEVCSYLEFFQISHL